MKGAQLGKKWVPVNVALQSLGKGKTAQSERMGGRRKGTKLEAIIKWNMEGALEGTSESALCILMECETARKPLSLMSLFM